MTNSVSNLKDFQSSTGGWRTCLAGRMQEALSEGCRKPGAPSSSLRFHLPILDVFHQKVA